MLIPLTFTWGMTTRQRDLRGGLLAVTLGLVLVAILTQSRGAYLAFAAMIGIMTIIWMLRPESRARLPRRLQPLFHPYFILSVTALGLVIAFFVLYQIIVNPSQPNQNDAARLDLWNSAVTMFRDHFLLGVGPYQFKETRLYYGVWRETYSLHHAHNLLFNVVAEGGVILLGLAVALIVRFSRVWWAAWSDGTARQRRRLEAGLAALLAFGVHNMVDTFLQTQLLIPSLIILAYVAAHDPEFTRQQASVGPSPRRHRIEYAGVIGALVACQIIFVPILRGAYYQQRYLVSYREQEYDKALQATRQAQKADPWLDLYSLEEATMLGYLADENPAAYLDDSIAAFETTLSQVPIWDMGWLNLAGLYAQAGRYQDAIHAQSTLIEQTGWPHEYHFNLGVYYVLAGERETGYAILFDVLKEQPWRILSDLWTTASDFSDFPAAALEHFRGTVTEVPLLAYSGDTTRLAELRQAFDNSAASPEIRAELDILWPPGAITPCLYCYHVRHNSDLLEAETLLHEATPETVPASEIERLARRQLVLQYEDYQWAWYILARLADLRGTGTEEIDNYLGRTVRMPDDYRRSFPFIYRMRGGLSVIPQARMPLLSPLDYEPWLMLANRKAQSGEWDEVKAIYDSILAVDPYAHEDIWTVGDEP
jgi:tetratricopeptide (TPR) repeat protein